MKKHLLKRSFAGILTAAFLICGFSQAGFPVSSSAAQTAMVSASSLNIRSGPGTDYSRISAVPRGTVVTILSEETGSDGNTWAEISVSGTTGYVLESYLSIGSSTSSGASSDSDFESQLSAQGFPESYKERLRAIHAQYPNWVFQAVQTGLDWEDAVKNESVIGRNLVSGSSISSWKSTAEGAYNWSTGTWPSFDSGNWVAASEDVIRYYMDPRNFLDSSNIFQFLSQNYDASTQTADGVELLAEGTFLQGTYSGNTSSGSGTDSSSGSTTAPDGSTTGDSVSLVSPSGETASSGSSSSETSGTSETSNSSAEPTTGSSSAIGVISDAPQEKSSDGEVRAEGPSDFLSASVPEFSGSSADESGTSLKADARAIVGHGASSYNSSGSSESTESTGSTGNSGSSGSSGDVNYIDIIMEAAEKSGVNPYVLTSMILQEQGTSGGGTQISGTNSSYPGIYNFFNIEAYSDGSMSAAVRGLWWASQSGSYGRPWNTIEKSIVGGAEFYGENFIAAGQNTFYTKKFNVTQNNRYQHQYMTNVKGAADEGLELGKAYTDSMRSQTLVFNIPVYSNMPEEPSPLPTKDGSPNNRLKNLSVDGFSITPSFDISTFEYDLIVDPSVSSITVSAQTVDGKAYAAGTGTISLNESSQDVNIVVTAENGDTVTYVIHVTKQQGGQTGNAGSSSSGESSGTSGNTAGTESASGNATVSSGTVTNSAPSSGTQSSDSVQLVSPSGN